MLPARLTLVQRTGGQVRNRKRQPIADTWLGAAFLTLLPGPLYYLPAFIVPLTLLASAYGAAHAADLLRFAAGLPVVQRLGGPLAARLAAAATSPAAAARLSVALSLTTFFYEFIAVPLLDLLLGCDLRDPLRKKSEAEGENREAAEGSQGGRGGAEATARSAPTSRLLDLAYRAILWTYVPTHLCVMLAAARTACGGGLHPAAALGLAISAGFSGGELFVVAHELLHGSRLDRALCNLLLASVGYMHWSESHLAHHIKVATPEDPASARRGESLYAFFPRSVWGNLVDGYGIESQRLAAAGLPLWSPRNRMLVWIAAPLALLGAAHWAYGWAGVGFAMLQAFLAVFSLETVNYIEHWGLTRRKLPSGRYERVGPRHSWTAGHLFTNASVFRLQRHADHHEYARKPYQELRDLPDSSVLPADYPALMICALCPPLFFRVMDPLLDGFYAREAARELKED